MHWAWSLASPQPQRIADYFDPIPFWYPPFEGEMVSETEFPMHAVTQRPMAMYHSWGSQNAWLRQIMARIRERGEERSSERERIARARGRNGAPLEQLRRLVEVRSGEHHRLQPRRAACEGKPDIAGAQPPIVRAPAQ